MLTDPPREAILLLSILGPASLAVRSTPSWKLKPVPLSVMLIVRFFPLQPIFICTIEA